MRTEQNTAFFVSVTANLQEVLSIGTDLQRNIRNYQVVRDQQYKGIVDSLLRNFTDKLSRLCRTVEDIGECTSLSNSLPILSQYDELSDELVVEAYLARLNQSLLKLQNDVNHFVETKVVEQQQYLTEMQNRQAWSSGILVVLSMFFIGFSVQFIARPVGKLQHIIRAIASSTQQLPSKSLTAPRELLAVEKDLYWLNDRLTQLEKVRLALLRHASHELKTPLASIKEGCAILSDNLLGSLNKEQQEVLLLLVNSTQRLNLLVEKLLDYNALLQQAEPDFSHLRLEKEIKECADRYSLLLSQNGQSLNIEIDKSLVVFAETQLLQRIFDNLISNAIAYAKKDSRIKIIAIEANKYINIQVKNNGKPIEASNREVLFEPFKRGSDTRNDRVMGAGLGLSIVVDCTRLLHGSVEIIDVDDADVCFQVSLLKGK